MLEQDRGQRSPGVGGQRDGPTAQEGQGKHGVVGPAERTLADQGHAAVALPEVVAAQGPWDAEVRLDGVSGGGGWDEEHRRQSQGQGPSAEPVSASPSPRIVSGRSTSSGGKTAPKAARSRVPNHRVRVPWPSCARRQPSRTSSWWSTGTPTAGQCHASWSVLATGRRPRRARTAGRDRAATRPAAAPGHPGDACGASGVPQPGLRRRARRGSEWHPYCTELGATRPLSTCRPGAGESLAQGPDPDARNRHRIYLTKRQPTIT